MPHPDSHTAEVLDRNTRAVDDATGAPPPDLTDNPAAYMAWLRTPGQRIARATRPPAGRRFLPKTPRRPHKERDPAYPAAAAHLATLPDLGAAHIEQARGELGDATWEVLVIRAAELNERT